MLSLLFRFVGFPPRISLKYGTNFPQVIKEVFLEAFPTESACRNMCPVGVVCIELLPEDIDVNLEPNKTAVLFHDIVSVLFPVLQRRK